jgi:hypothetical protein
MENQPKKKFYKRWWFWVIVVVVLLIILGSKGANTPQKVGESTSDSTSQQSATFKVGDNIKLGNSIVTVNSVEYSQGGQYSKPAEGNEWINLNITVENTGSSQQYLTTLGQMFIRDADKNSYQVSVTNKSMENPGFGLDGAIIAQSKRTGWVGFEIKKGATGLQFQYNGSMFGGGSALVDLGR